MRAGLRAELRERGHDALGARDLTEALREIRPTSDRGPVGLVVIDQSTLGEVMTVDALEQLRARVSDLPVVLIAPGNRETAEGDWTTVLRRPISIGDIADFVRRLIPDAPSASPLDD